MDKISPGGTIPGARPSPIRDNGSDDSKPRHELEQSVRRTYPPTHKEGDEKPLTLESATQTEPMYYGAIMQFQVVPHANIPDTFYGLGVDGGVYTWDRVRKSWALVNK